MQILHRAIDTGVYTKNESNHRIGRGRGHIAMVVLCDTESNMSMIIKIQDLSFIKLTYGEH